MCFNCLIVTHWFHESMKKNRQKPAAAGFNPSLWVGKKLRKTSHSISYEYVTVTNAFAVKFEGLRSSVVSRRLLRFHFQRRSLSWSKLIQVARGPLGLPRILGCSLLLCRSAMAKRKSGGCRVGFQSFCMRNVTEFVSSHIKTKQPSCAKNLTPISWQFPTCARRCHFCMGIS